MKGEATVSEVAKKVKLPQPAVSQHLKILKEGELVNAHREGQEVFYSINVAYMTNLLKKLTADVKHK